MTSHVDSLWASICKRVPAQKQACLTSLREHLRQSNNPHARVLSGLPVTSRPDEDSARQLEAEVVAQHRRGRINRYEAATWLTLIRRAVETIAKGGIKIAPTRLAAVVPPESSPFSALELRKAEDVEFWQHALNHWVRSDKAASRQEWMAALLLSSILNGALLNATKVRHLLEYLNEGRAPDREAPGRYSYCFDLPFRGLGYHHLQRWHFDPLTAMLLFRMPKDGEGFSENGIQPAITQFLKACSVPDKRLPRTLKQLIDAATIWWFERSPPLAVSTSTRAIAAHGFHRRTWTRLMNRPSEGVGDITRRYRNTQIANPDVDDLSPLHPWLEEAMEIIQGKDAEKISTALLQLAEREGRALSTTYLRWAASLLLKPSSSGDVLSLGIVRRRLAATIPRLLASLGDTDPKEMDTESLCDVYSELTSEPSLSAPITDLVGGLRDFHAWLVKEYKKSHIRHVSEVFGDEGGINPVDANLPSLDEYNAAQQWLDRRLGYGWTEEDIEQCKVILALAYKAGMRRMEILGLRISDLQFKRGMVVLVRPHKIRRLKTKASRRVIPIRYLFSTEERLSIKRLVERRRHQTGIAAELVRHDAFLFSGFEGSNRLSWADRICDKVCLAIREVTGDQRLFLHHLRHACATWNYLRLWAADFPMLADFFGHLPETRAVLRCSQRLKIGLLGGSVRATRRYGFAIARLLGHSSPQVSFGHYIHASDLLALAVVERESSHMERGLFVAASGMSTSAAYDQLSRGYPKLVEAVRAKWTEQPDVMPKIDLAGDGRKRPRGRPRTAVAEKKYSWFSSDVVRQVLNLDVVAGKNSKFIANHLKLPVSVVDSIRLQASVWAPRVGLSVVDGRLQVVPRLPRGDTERELHRRLEIKFEVLAERDPEALAAGLDIHIRHYHRQVSDVVFRAEKDSEDLQRYLAFLQQLGMDISDFRWVLRICSREECFLPPWICRLEVAWMPSKIRRINPPVQLRASTYAKWAGLEVIQPEKGRSLASYFAVLCFLARLALVENH